ncbi:hypothetical protein V6N12_065149 [Hibiscus sabdariffa]|uniref:RNase H type-1 domain-containing protein n=1 Tax=Hibiscus sabdariffa TaxID=183260 RepID=A0ABR2G8Q5_9ROSI
MVDTKGDWKWELIQNRLPDHILLQLAAIQRPKPSFPVDSIGWKLRNDGEFSAKTTYQVSKWLAETTIIAAAKARQLPGSISTPAVWNPPAEGWLKLNANGARSLIDGRASCGGVLRGHNGNWIHGFTKFIDRCSVVEVELWGIATGMELAWSLGCRQLVVESDSAEALCMIQQHSSKGGPYIIVSHLHQLCNKDWRIVFSKFARCNNGVADWLAKFASDSNFDVVSFEAPPDGLELG